MTFHLYDNGAFTFSETADSGYTVGMRFGVTAAVVVSGLRWFRHGSSTNDFPTRLTLWKVSDSSLVAEVASVTNVFGEGWHDEALAAPVTLVAGQSYICAAWYPAGHIRPQGVYSAKGSAPAPLIWDDIAGRYIASNAFPTNGVTDRSHPADVIVGLPTGGSDGSTGAGGGATSGDLEAWLSTDATLNKRHDDSAPYKTYNLAIGADGLAAIKAVADTIATSVGSGLRTAVTTLTTNLATANAALVHAANTWSDALASTLQAMSDDFASFFNTVGGTAGGPTGALSGRSAFPDTGWSLADETDWDTDLAWQVAADLYVVTVTTPPPGMAADDFAGVTWYHRLGSWTILNGDQAGARAFLEFSPQQLQDGGRRMPGLALRTKNGTLGHVQAWLLA